MNTSSIAETTSLKGKQAWCDRVRAMGPMIEKSAEEDEDRTELAPAVVKAMDDAGIFAMMVPRELGGAEAHPEDLIDAISELAYWDGSAGWYAHAVMTGGSVAGAFLGPRATEAIFPDGRFQHAAGQAAPTGRAERVDDGYRVSGRFSFGSGSPQAQWIVGGYILHEDGEPVMGEHGQPVMLIGLAPRDKVTFKGNWDVLGLRGTGSYDFEVNEQILHEDFVFVAGAPQQRRGGPLYGMGFMAIPSLSHAAFAIGATRRIIDEWREFAKVKPRAPGKMANETETLQRDIAMASADQRAAEAYVRRTFSKLFDAAEAKAIPDDLRLDGRLCASHAFAVAMRVSQAAFSSCTTYSVRNGNALQRAFRDIHAGNAHFLTAEQSWIDAGKVVAGVDGATIVF